jgi:hypothetical protein
MADDIGILRSTTVDGTDAPGQTFCNFLGDGGNFGRDEGTELADEREQWSHWFLLHRPPATSAYNETEVIIKRLGPDDSIITGSRNLKILAAAQTALTRDLVEGEIMLYTGDGTDSSWMAIQPGGDILLKTSGTVQIGGTAADSPIARYNELKTLYDSVVPPLGQQFIFDNHVHPDPVAGVTGAPTTSFPAWDVNAASTSGECD